MSQKQAGERYPHLGCWLQQASSLLPSWSAKGALFSVRFEIASQVQNISPCCSKPVSRINIRYCSIGPLEGTLGSGGRKALLLATVVKFSVLLLFVITYEEDLLWFALQVMYTVLDAAALVLAVVNTTMIFGLQQLQVPCHASF